MREDEDMTDLDRDESGPVDMLSALFEARGWTFERAGEDELTGEVKGSWTTYQLRAVWRDEDNVLQLIILPDIIAPSDKWPAIYEALGLINEQIWLGHFDLWSSSGTVLFRHAAMMAASGLIGVDQAQTIVDVALDECERFYPVFQFILWGGKSAREAIDAALIETHGEA